MPPAETMKTRTADILGFASLMLLTALFANRYVDFSIAPYEDAAMLMFKRHFSLIPVVEGDRLVGIVRRIDILARLYATH